MTTVARHAMLEVEDLRVHFPTETGRTLRAVDGVSLSLWPGETLGLVGESGCGKSTLARAVVGLIEPTAGSVRFMGEPVNGARGRRRRQLHRHLQMIFQDPRSSLNPRMTVGAMLEEPLLVHGVAPDRQTRRAAVREALEHVGLSPETASRRPHELSGGQAQRVAVARALMLKPRLMVCDEAVSSLDVSIQAQIVNLLAELRDRLGLAYLFIAHNLAVVRHLSDRVAVMYLGRIVEVAPAGELFERPYHPYTRGLLAAALPASPDARQRLEAARRLIQGEPANPLEPPSGCAFRTRCGHATQVCAQRVPVLEPVTDERPTTAAATPEAPGAAATAAAHQVACHRWREIAGVPGAACGNEVLTTSWVV